MVLSDRSIRLRRSLAEDHPQFLRIDPFVDSSPPGVVSYGLTSGGYDIRVADEFMVFTNMCSGTVDPKSMPEGAFIRHTGHQCLIPPNSFALGRSVETVRIPRDVIGVCLGKSTYARCGVIVTVTPLEPEWEGIITIEISNTTPRPAVVHSNEGIMQVLFHMLSTPCDTSYVDKKGRYQGQKGITLPFVK